MDDRVDGVAPGTKVYAGFPVPVLALTMCAFCIGTAEFVVMGLLPDIAQDLAVSIPLAGQLVTAYALGVVIGAPVLAVATGKMPRKRVLLLMVGVFIIGNFLSAISPNYALLMIARILAAFAHGTLFGVGAIVAADLVPPNKRASAIGLMFTGLTLANILGVPLGTLHRPGLRLARHLLGDHRARHRCPRSRSPCWCPTSPPVPRPGSATNSPCCGGPRCCSPSRRRSSPRRASSRSSPISCRSLRR